MGDEQGLQIDACERNPYARGIAGRDAGPWAKATDLATQEHRGVQACRATAGSIAIGRRASRAAHGTHLNVRSGTAMKAQHQKVPGVVTVGSQVTWYPKSERWRVEVVHPSTMKAAFIKA